MVIHIAHEAEGDFHQHEASVFNYNKLSYEDLCRIYTDSIALWM